MNNLYRLYIYMWFILIFSDKWSGAWFHELEGEKGTVLLKVMKQIGSTVKSATY